MANPFADFLRQGVNSGMTEPLYLVSIASNGNVLVALYNSEHDGDTVCERIIAPGLELPILLTLISPDEGRAMCRRLKQGDDGVRLMPTH